MKTMTAEAAYVDFIIGKYIRKKIPISLRPSIRAASIVSMGKLRLFCRNIMIINGVARPGIMNAHTVFSIFICEIMVNRGISVATCGTIIASRRMAKSLSLPLSWYSSKP